MARRRQSNQLSNSGQPLCELRDWLQPDVSRRLAHLLLSIDWLRVISLQGDGLASHNVSELLLLAVLGTLLQLRPSWHGCGGGVLAAAAAASAGANRLAGKHTSWWCSCLRGPLG